MLELNRVLLQLLLSHRTILTTITQCLKPVVFDQFVINTCLQLQLFDACLNKHVGKDKVGLEG